jgi:predicted nucleotidyltransferase
MDTIVSVMDTFAPDTISNVLFGKTRRAILGLLFTRPDEWIHLRQVARLSGSAIGPVQRELAQLVAVGILERASQGNQIVFRANPQSPVHAELKSIVIKTVGVGDTLRAALAPVVKRVRAAFVYGSFARGEPHQSSDVDVLIIGDLPFHEAVAALQVAQTTIGREVNPSVYSALEFAQKLRSGHHFVSAVVKGPKIFLLGDERELKRLAQERVAESSRPKPRRDSATRTSRNPRLARL